MTGAMADCPCRGCTAETGRGQGCHCEACPRGWADWNRLHIAERNQRRAEEHIDQAATGIIIGAARRNGRRKK